MVAATAAATATPPMPLLLLLPSLLLGAAGWRAEGPALNRLEVGVSGGSYPWRQGRYLSSPDEADEPDPPPPPPPRPPPPRASPTADFKPPPPLLPPPLPEKKIYFPWPVKVCPAELTRSRCRYLKNELYRCLNHYRDKRWCIDRALSRYFPSCSVGPGPY